MKKVSLADVAKSLGVSKTLVSLVLNGKGDEKGINKDTQQRVRDKVKELNYKPNQFARGLRVGKSNTIGLVVADISNAFYAKMCRSIEDHCTLNGYNLIICSSDEKPEKESELIGMLIDRQVDGLIISTTQKNNSDIKMLKKNDFPFVLIDRNVDAIDTNYVVVDNIDGAKQVVNHLVKLGNERIGHITITPAHISTIKERVEGYKQALRDNGIPASNKLIKEVSFDNLKADVKKQVKDLLAPPNKVTALFVANNNIAVACLESLNELGMRIPQDVALVSFDDIDAFNLCYPPVTAIDQPIGEMGKKAVDIILDEIKAESPKEKTQQYALKTDLIIRKSCGH